MVAKDLVHVWNIYSGWRDLLHCKTREIFGLLGLMAQANRPPFKMLCGLLMPTEGIALVNNINLQKAPGKARGAYWLYGAKIFSLWKFDRRPNWLFQGVYEGSASVKETLDLFDLEEHKNEFCDELSLEREATSNPLAAAIAHWPDILFLR